MEPTGLAAIATFGRLAYLKRGTFAGGQSSYDRAGGNDDHDQYLGTDSLGDHIILDLEGSGVVYRMWFTGMPFDGFPRPDLYIRIFIDGEPTGRTKLLTDIFIKPKPPFSSPLVGAVGKGLYCYLPIPFNRSIKITTNALPFVRGGPDEFFYNIGYHLYAPGTQVISWTEREDTRAAGAVWNNAAYGKHPDPAAHGTTTAGEKKLVPDTPGTGNALADVDGPGSIETLRLSSSTPLTPELLLNVVLRIWWDDYPDAAVDAPIGMFFAAGMFGGVAHARSIAVGVAQDGSLYCHFPMPFRRRAHIELVNLTGSDLDIRYSIRTTAIDPDFSDVGYFRTRYRVHTSVPQQSLEVLDIRGAGHLVGAVVSLAGAPDLFFLEGDERIYIDGARTAAIHGTGTEDFFNGAWYFADGPESLPVHGCTTKSTHNGLISAYRLFIPDSVPYRSRIRMTLEHGYVNDIPVTAWTLAYFYHQPVVQSWPVDTLDIGDAASEGAHGYHAEPTTWTGRVTAQFEGDYAAEKIEEEPGLAHRGRSSFVMAIPKHNTGVVLRRLSNLRIADQKAEVSVDSNSVGIWYVAGGAHGVAGLPDVDKWSENDFFIPPAHTQGRTLIEIKLEFLSSAWDWNEFRYTAFALNETANAYPRLISPRLSAAGVIGAASRSTDHLDVLVADTAEAALATMSWEPGYGGPWLRWPAPSLAAVPAGAPVHLVSRSTDKLDGFFTTATGEIHTASWESGSSGWTSGPIAARLLPGSGGPTPAVAPGAHITAVCKQRDFLDVFAAAGGAVYTAAWPSTDPRRPADWMGWWPIPGLPAEPASRVEAVSRGAGKIDVFTVHAEAGGGEIYTAAWQPGFAAWAAGRLRDRMQPGSVPPVIPPHAAVTAIFRDVDHLDIFVVDSRGAVCAAAWEPGFATWHGWWTLPVITGVPGGIVAAVSRAPNKIDLFTADATGEISTAAWEPGLLWRGARLRNWLKPGSYTPYIPAGAPVTAVSRRPDWLDIFVAGSDGRVWTAAAEPDIVGWNGWKPVGY